MNKAATSDLGTAPDVSTRLSAYYRWHAHLYDLTRWAFLFGRKRLVRQVARHTTPKRILEIGCGTGSNLALLAHCFPNAELVGMDLSSDMLAKARQKLSAHSHRITLLHQAYLRPSAPDARFDLVVISYCLTMVNPGYRELLAVAQQDLTHDGHIAIVDFHQSPSSAFRRWMGVNHVRMEGQVLQALTDTGYVPLRSEIRPAYGGLWSYLLYIGRRPGL